MSGDKLIERIVERVDEAIYSLGLKKRQLTALILLFILGFAAGAFAVTTLTHSPQKQVAEGENNNLVETISALPFSQVSGEKNSPFDWIQEDQIHVYKDRIIIDLKNAEWATFTDTNSMDPVIDFGANAIELVPKTEEDIHTGDIISYNSDYVSGTIIHRVVETGYDEYGWYCRTKGDNNENTDPGKIRFGQIQRVVVAVIY